MPFPQKRRPSPPRPVEPDGEPQPVVAATVKEIRESPRRPGRYTLVLSDGRTLTLGIEALSDAGATRVGVLLDVPVVERLIRESTVTDLADRALGFLARGRRTRLELEQRLRRREPDRALVASALDRLERAGILSDADVAAAEASARLRRGEAPARVRQTLRRKGIGDRLTSEAVSTAVREDDFDEAEACRVAAAKRARALASLDTATAKRRLTGFLARRGFSGSIVRTVVDETLGRR